jgi:hypothetical protein
MIHITTIATLYYLLYFQVLRRRKTFKTPYSLPRIRNILFEYRLREQHGSHIRPFVYSKSLLSYMDILIASRLDHILQDKTDGIRERRMYLEQPQNLFTYINYDEIPELRLPRPGLQVLPFRYYKKSPGLGYIEATERVLINDPLAAEEPLDRKPETYSIDIDLSGNPPHPEILKIISEWFPHYSQYLDYYCRPHSFGPQAFYDFNRTTTPHPFPTQEREAQIHELMLHIMNLKPYYPLHIAEALASGIPLSTSASYNSKYSPDEITIAKVSSPRQYAEKLTSKGHFINNSLTRARQVIHNIKNKGTPYGDTLDDSLNLDSAEHARLENFIISEPTELFIRSQISKRDPNEPKKIRPVYAVSLLFILIEIMLTYCMIIQLRNPECAVLHGLETFRGGMIFIDRAAHSYTSYVSLDWSQFDQRLPLYVIIYYFTKWIPHFLIINKGYCPTHTYPDSKSKHATPLAIKMFNLLQFLLIWYINMVFISYDGYAYTRENGGVPSGLYNTQSLDSVGNAYIIIDELLEFGFTIPECKDMLFFILGDDNIFFARQNFQRICDFMIFLEHDAKRRHGMVLSTLKSVWTTIRTKIEVLGYSNDFGFPSRPVGKLVAQLALPERPVKHDWMHAARALGLAYAACGQHADFHLLCYMIYIKFKPITPVPLSHFRKSVKYVLLEILEIPDTCDFISFPDFPSLMDVRRRVSEYHGSFNQEDHWKTNIFASPPTNVDSDTVTLATWLKDHPEFQFSWKHIMHGYSCPETTTQDLVPQ